MDVIIVKEKISEKKNIGNITFIDTLETTKITKTIQRKNR